MDNWNSIPVITSEMLARQRYTYSLEPSRGYLGLSWYQDISRTSNYFAPNHWFMYSWEDGTQDNLWYQRRIDGQLWSAFKNRDIENSQWWTELKENR